MHKIALSCLMLITATTIVASPANELTRHLGHYSTYQANFNQTTFDDHNQLQQQSKGYIYIQRPDKFRWDTYSPAPSALIENDNTLWNYDKSLQQVTKRTVTAKDIAQTPAVLLTNRIPDVTANYNVKTITLQKQNWFLLIPKSKQANFQKVYFHFNKQGYLDKLIEVNNLGDKSLYVFSNIKPNRVISSHIFNFVPPRGVDVLDQDHVN